MRFVIAGSLLFLFCLAPAEAASRFAPAILFNSDVVMDNAYNEQLLQGIQTYADRKHYDYQYKATSDPDTYRRYLNQLIEAGRDPILTPGPHRADIVADVAARHSNVTFITIDYTLDLPNVHSIVFRVADAAFLAGVLAAHKTQTQTLGFVGGMMIPAIQAFESGFAAGARSVNPDIQVEQRYLSRQTSLPFEDPDAAYQTARQLLNAGSDIIFTAAGSSGEGAMRAIGEAGALAIGVDSNQNGLYPGTVLTSVLKNLDRAVYVALVSEHWGLWRNQVKRLGLAQGGVGLAMDENNAPLISDELRETIARARSDILANRIVFDGSAVDANQSRPREMRVLLPDREQWPYITDTKSPGNNQQPGLVIDALNITSQQLGVTFNYDRQPLRRGVYSLIHNKADALLVKSISPELKAQAVYPGDQNGLDPNRALMHWDLAVYRRADSPTGADYRLMPIAVPLGTRIADELARKGVSLLASDNLKSRLGMLMRERVNTVVADPLHADYLIAQSPELKKRVIKTADAIGEEASYLLVSRSFYEQYPQFSENLWNRLSQVRESVELWDLADRYFDRHSDMATGQIPSSSAQP